MNGSAKHLHHRPPVWLLVVASSHLPDLAFKVKHLACKGKCCSPLAGAGLGGELFDPSFGVVIRLRNGSVGFMRPGWAGAFVLVVDPGWCP